MHKLSTTTRRSALAIFLAGLVAPTFSASALSSAVTVHKDPNCGCCTGWVRHLKDAGLAVTIEETADLQAAGSASAYPATLQRATRRKSRDT